MIIIQTNISNIMGEMTVVYNACSYKNKNVYLTGWPSPVVISFGLLAAREENNTY